MTDNITALLKLFETLSSSIDKHEITTRELINQQHDLVNHIQKLPIDGLNSRLKDHSGLCTAHHEKNTENINIKDKDLNTKVDSISTKMKIMSVIVIVAFTITMGAFTIFKSEKSDIEKTNKATINRILQNLDEHEKQNTELIKLMRNLHDDKYLRNRFINPTE